MLEMIDGFDHYTSSANLKRKWDSTSEGSSQPGRFAGNSWNVYIGVGIFLSGLTNQATRVVGFAMKTQALGTPGAGSSVFGFYDSATIQVQLGFTNTGALVVSRGGSTILGTSSTLLGVNTWYYIELSVTIGSSGSFELKVNGATVASGSANTQATANAYSNQIKFPCQWTSGQTVVDDLYILNSTGSVNNTFLGDCRIYTTLASADGASSAWTPNSGTAHFSRVNEANPDDDSTYVSSGTVGQIDTYQYPDISPTGVIAGVQVTLTDRKDDTAARTICAEYRSGGGTNYDGATSFAPATSYGMHRQIWETDPATSAAWTAANINAAEFGVKVKT